MSTGTTNVMLINEHVSFVSSIDRHERIALIGLRYLFILPLRIQVTASYYTMVHYSSFVCLLKRRLN